MQSGFHLERVGPYSFSCQKLGQISVKIYSKENGEEPIPSVLLSLSGDNGYRNNSVSNAGGVFLFNDLFPGTFYLRPLLKVLEELFNIICLFFPVVIISVFSGLVSLISYTQFTNTALWILRFIYGLL